jgi:DNA-binding XRE family transcriptional regulator
LKTTPTLKARIIDPAERDLHRLKPNSRVCTSLACMRIANGNKQLELAKTLGVTQGHISKLESGADCDLTLGQINDYAQATKWGRKLTLILDVKTGFWRVAK